MSEKNTQLANSSGQQMAPATSPLNAPNIMPQVNPSYKNLSTVIVPIQLQRIRQNTLTWRDAIVEMEYAYYPYRVKAQQMFNDTAINGHVTACVERRKDLTLLRKFEFIDGSGKLHQKTMDIFTNNVKGKNQAKGWFQNFVSYALDAINFGYSLVALGDIVENQFPQINSIKRWNISPDRMQVTTFPYQPNGFKFEEEPFKDWHIYVDTPNEIGTSRCGYGLFYKIAIYEIFMRNLLGFNGDFVELYAQPYRVGKTNKTEEGERAEFAAAIAQMGSNGWALIDPTDEISFLETALGGTGYKAYDNFEQRLQKVISKVMLGHADALDSTPGKLGSSDGEFSPGQKALEDKQTKDGIFIENIVNDKLLKSMRALGFLIPDDVNLSYKNDAEVMQNANGLADIAGKMKNAGLQMDVAYWNQETGILATLIPAPVPFGGGSAQPPAPDDAATKTEKAKARTQIKEFYNSKHVHRHSR